jgi:hypothetical protein
VGCDATGADNRVLPGIQRVRQYLVVRDGAKERAPGVVFTPGCVNTFAEFGQYQWASNRDGLRDEPRKTNDHTMDTLRYLIMGVVASMTDTELTSETRKYA